MFENVIKINGNNFKDFLSFFNIGSSMQKDILFSRICNHEKDIFVLNYNNKFVATIMVTYCNNHIYLSNLFVLEEYRNKGYGKKILSHAISYAESKNYDKVSCKVRENNSIAINMYDEFGFKVQSSNNDGDGAYYEIYKDLNKLNRKL